MILTILFLLFFFSRCSLINCHFNTLMMWCVCEPLYIIQLSGSLSQNFDFGIKFCNAPPVFLLYNNINTATGVMCMWASVVLIIIMIKTSGPQSQHLQWSVNIIDEQRNWSKPIFGNFFFVWLFSLQILR